MDDYSKCDSVLCMARKETNGEKLLHAAVQQEAEATARGNEEAKVATEVGLTSILSNSSSGSAFGPLQSTLSSSSSLHL